MALLCKRRSIAGSIIGGIAETWQVLDFCAANGIVAATETIPTQTMELPPGACWKATSSTGS